MATRSKGGGAGKSSAGAEKAAQSQLFPEPEPAGAGEGRMMYSLPPRFRAYSEPEHHMVVLVDEQTGKQVPVAIGAYGEVRRVLGALFGGEAEESDDYVPPSVEPLAETAVPPPRGLEPASPEGEEPRAAAAPPKRVPGPVEVPAPPKRLIGIALRSYKRKWLVDHGYDPDQDAVIAGAAPPAGTPAPAGRAEAPSEAGRAAPRRRAKAPTQAPAAAGGPVEIPAPPKRLVGIALRSYRRKWLADHGYDPDQDAVIAGTAPPEAGREPARAEPKREGPVRIPEGWEPIVEGEGYVMEFALDPETHANAYRVVVDGDVVGWLRQEGPTRFVLHSPQGLWPESVHRNILGARTRLDVMYEPEG